MMKLITMKLIHSVTIVLCRLQRLTVYLARSTVGALAVVCSMYFFARSSVPGIIRSIKEGKNILLIMK